MKKQIKRIAAALLATGMLLCAMPVAAFAEDDLVGGYLGKPTPIPQDNNPYQQDQEYADCTGTKAELKKYLKLGVKHPSGTDIPYASCSFTIYAVDPNKDVHYTAGWKAVKGVFNTNGTTQENLPDVTFGPKNGTISGDKAVQNFSYDFKNVLDANKYQSGYVYCYKIAETACKPDYIKADFTDVRYVDVYVGTNNGGAESILKVIVYRLKTDWGGQTTAYKNNDFCNDYCTTTLDLTKLITGNQCKKDKKFNFTVVIDTKVPEDKMTGYTMYINKVHGSSDLNGKTLTVDTDGMASASGTMTDSDKVQITNIPVGSTYTVTENPDGYVLTISTKCDPTDKDFTAPTYSTKIGQVTWQGYTTPKDCQEAPKCLVFKNTKNGNIPTGVVLDVAPYALMVGLALAGIVVFGIRKRRAQ